MLNSGFIPEVVDASAINSQINSMQSSVNSINNSFSTINSRLTQLEKDISADVLKATEVVPAVNYNNNVTQWQISLTKDSQSYSRIILKVNEFKVSFRDGTSFSVSAQQIKLSKSGSATINLGSYYRSSNDKISHYFVVGNKLNLTSGSSWYRPSGIVSLSITYNSTNKLTIMNPKTTDKYNGSYFELIDNVITVEYY